MHIKFEFSLDLAPRSSFENFSPAFALSFQLEKVFSGSGSCSEPEREPENHCIHGHPPCKASEIIAKELGLKAAEEDIVFKVLDQTDEDPVLVIRLNQNWIATHTEARANVLLDYIATYDMINERRDDQVPRLCFRFAEGSHIVACRKAVLNAHFDAFAPSPDMLNLLNARNIPWAGNREQLGVCVQINKIGVRRNDIQSFPFFNL
uniref:Uncharacterized protein n=1 Tax=Ditylenchus dipsaci TaxID=166011 RepID=A0A915EGY3_9BILA